MNNRDVIPDMKAGNREPTYLLRIGVIFLAVVSFFTTANGMREYIFHNKAIAYAASAAIQGILLALSMNFPSYLRAICREPLQGQDKGFYWLRKIGRFLVNTLLCLIVLLLTGVVIFCSSWFSYVYIAETIHQDSWGSDSELLVQQTYRAELYDAQDYAHRYRNYLEGDIGEKILQLEGEAMALSDFVADMDMDWETERQNYVPDDGSSVASYMAEVINAMEEAMESGSSQEARDIAVTAISDAKENIEIRMADIQQNINTLAGNITGYNEQVTNLRTQLARLPEGVDPAPYTNSLNTYLGLVNAAVQRQAILQTEYMDLERALERLPLYESRLGLSSSTSSLSIRSLLLELQTEFFQSEPDKTHMLELATEIFENLQKASRSSGAEGGIASVGDDETLLYMNLLTQMNNLNRNLTDYSELADIETALNGLVEELRTETFAGRAASFSSTSAGPEGISSLAATDGPEGTQAVSGTDVPEETSPISETDAAEESLSISETETAEETLPPGEEEESEGEDGVPAESSSALGSETSERETPSEEEASSKGETPLEESVSAAQDSAWKAGWSNRLAALKAQISALPVFIDDMDTDGETVTILSKSQIEFLRSYDREESSRILDDMIRRYISEHNAIYQGIIYLQSPYRSLALFALVLAFSFDISGFIFGFVVQGETRNGDAGAARQTEADDSEKQGDGGEAAYVSVQRDGIQAEWSVLEMLTPYLVLTGDYEKQDGIYYYEAFRDGEQYRWEVHDTQPYSQGIYIQKGMQGELIPSEGQALLFESQAGRRTQGWHLHELPACVR